MFTLNEVIVALQKGRLTVDGEDITLHYNSTYFIEAIPLHCCTRAYEFASDYFPISRENDIRAMRVINEKADDKLTYLDIAQHVVNQCFKFYHWLTGGELTEEPDRSNFITELTEHLKFIVYVTQSTSPTTDGYVMNVGKRVAWYITIEDLYASCYRFTRHGTITEILLDLEEEQDFIKK